MTEDAPLFTHCDGDGLARLLAAVNDTARPEIERLANAAIAALKSSKPIGYYPEVAARHTWDEYCWGIHEAGGDWEADAWRDLAVSAATAQVEALPRHMATLLTASLSEDVEIGSIWNDGIVEAVMEEVNTRAGARRLDNIGPDRNDIVPYEVDGSGVIWEYLGEHGDRADIIAGFVDDLIDPEADLSALATDLLDAFMDALKNSGDGHAAWYLVAKFEADIRKMLLEKDLEPMLDDMRDQMLDD